MGWRRRPTGRARSPRSRTRSAGRAAGSPRCSAACATCGAWSSPVAGRITSTSPGRPPRAAGRSGWTSAQAHVVRAEREPVQRSVQRSRPVGAHYPHGGLQLHPAAADTRITMSFVPPPAPQLPRPGSLPDRRARPVPRALALRRRPLAAGRDRALHLARDLRAGAARARGDGLPAGSQAGAVCPRSRREPATRCSRAPKPRTGEPPPGGSATAGVALVVRASSGWPAS